MTYHRLIPAILSRISTARSCRTPFISLALTLTTCHQSTDSSETHGAKDFSPRVFCRLRRMWGIKAEHYLQSTHIAPAAFVLSRSIGWAFTDTTVPMSALSPQDSKKEVDKKKAPPSKDEYSGPLEKNSTKSSFFIYSHDRRFLIKSLTLAEAVNLRSMLPRCVLASLLLLISHRYYIYMRYNPHSILTRIVGHHLLTVRHSFPLSATHSMTTLGG